MENDRGLTGRNQEQMVLENNSQAIRLSPKQGTRDMHLAEFQNYSEQVTAVYSRVSCLGMGVSIAADLRVSHSFGLSA